MKKTLTVFALMLFSTSFIISPAFAILENKDIKQAKQQANILDGINFDKWKKKNDQYLEGYIVKALENNTDIKTTALKIEEAKLNVTLTRSDSLPSISVGASPAVAKMPGSTKSEGTFAIPIMASWEIDLFGKNRDKTKASKKILESTQYEAKAVDISVISYVISTYYNIVCLDKIIEIQNKITNDRAEIYRLKKLANKEGIATTSDLILAEKSYILAQNDLIEYQKSRQNALNALAVLIGDSANNSKEYKRISFDKLSENFNIPYEISSEIITNRPDYKSAEKQLEAVGLNVRAAKKEFLPTIDILGVLGFIATSATSTMSFKNAVALLGGSANLPIFTGFKRVANVKLNKNKYEQILEQYQKTNLTAIQEINDSLYNFKSDNEKFVNNKRTYDIQKKDYELAKGKYDTGMISKLELLEQQETLFYIEKLTAQSKISCFMDEISLYKTTGAKI